MNITILTLGTRGDVEPYLALAVGLQRAGHRVRLVAPSAYADWIRSHGVDVHVQSVSVDDFAKQEAAERARGLFDRIAGRREMAERKIAWLMLLLDDYRAGSVDADFILQTGIAFGGIDIAHQRGVPMAFAFPHPFAPSREYLPYTAPLRLSLGGRWNYLTQWLTVRHVRSRFGQVVDRWRMERLGLPPLHSGREAMAAESGSPMLYAYSPNVAPKPADWAASDHVTGYWFLEPKAESGWQPPAEVVRFLEAGPPPVFVGFGSMRLHYPDRATRLVHEALRRSGRRAIISLGAGDSLRRMAASPEILYVDSVPHRWLFPRMAAVVHHGGAGTTAAVLKAGVPGIVVPVAYDQFGWSDRVRQLGVGLGSGHIATTTAGGLARMIRRAVEDGAIRRRAAALADKIGAERGVDAAIEIIERHARELYGASR